jgi:hypothetical protein
MIHNRSIHHFQNRNDTCLPVCWRTCIGLHGSLAPNLNCSFHPLAYCMHPIATRIRHDCTPLGRTDPSDFVDSDATIHSYSPCALRSIPSARGSNPMRLGLGFLFYVLSSSREPSFCNERKWALHDCCSWNQGAINWSFCTRSIRHGSFIYHSKPEVYRGCVHVIPDGTPPHRQYHRRSLLNASLYPCWLQKRSHKLDIAASTFNI